MENLITIETIPIEIEFVEKEPLHLSSVHNAQFEVKQADGQQQIQSKPIRIAIQDSFEPSQSYNWENSTYTVTSKLDSDGNLQLNLSLEDGEAKAIRFKQVNRSIDSMSSQAKGIESGSMQMSIPMTSLSSGMPDTSNFLPPDLELVVTQRPQVVIKYIGGPIYVPPSADPNYIPPLGFEQQQINVQQAALLDEKV
ncbi:MAG: hypothetical protein PWP30_1894 [Eubacteriaceae bacterium]|nr:hypothetical protein [Eubacteriaceae bacterium]